MKRIESGLLAPKKLFQNRENYFKIEKYFVTRHDKKS